MPGIIKGYARGLCSSVFFWSHHEVGGFFPLLKREINKIINETKRTPPYQKNPG